jgi:succinate dehydrogenase/fumarate reductase-like Fe-S protein
MLRSGTILIPEHVEIVKGMRSGQVCVAGGAHTPSGLTKIPVVRQQDTTVSEGGQRHACACCSSSCACRSQNLRFFGAEFLTGAAPHRRAARSRLQVRCLCQ